MSAVSETLPKAQSAAARPARRRRRLSPGLLAALPVILFLAVAFAAPLLTVFGYSFMPEKTFELGQAPTLENYLAVFSNSYYLSFGKSLGLALVTVALLMVISWPIAYGMAKLFGRWANILTLAIIIPLFVSENIRLFGWVLFLIKGGVMLGGLKAWLGIDAESMLYDVPAIVLGLVYVYLPFSLFPMVLGVSMVPREVTEAAFDMGASRWQVFREVELPLAMPGILIGGLLTFILAMGSLAESKILGGQAVIMIADEIETAFTFGQNWPLGSALSVILILFSGTLVLTLLSWIDLDKILGRGGKGGGND
jgi:spermidine/putrescine transport system permease protein